MQKTVTDEVLRYIKKQYKTEPEFLWANSPHTAALRHPEDHKWFGAIFWDMPREKLGLKEEGLVDILDLKGDPAMISTLIDGTRYLPGYHMNKEHWLTVLLDGTVALPEIFALIDESFQLTKKKK